MGLTGLIALSLAGCFGDYAYRHDVEGLVVDGDGPVAGATVQRVRANGTPFGDADLYVRTTDAAGRFDFEYGGLGPRPRRVATWHLRVVAIGHPPAEVTVDAPWIDAQEGYRAHDVVIRLEP